MRLWLFQLSHIDIAAADENHFLESWRHRPFQDCCCELTLVIICWLSTVYALSCSVWNVYTALHYWLFVDVVKKCISDCLQRAILSVTEHFIYLLTNFTANLSNFAATELCSMSCSCILASCLFFYVFGSHIASIRTPSESRSWNFITFLNCKKLALK